MSIINSDRLIQEKDLSLQRKTHGNRSYRSVCSNETSFPIQNIQLWLIQLFCVFSNAVLRERNEKSFMKCVFYCCHSLRAVTLEAIYKY